MDDDGFEYKDGGSGSWSRRKRGTSDPFQASGAPAGGGGGSPSGNRPSEKSAYDSEDRDPDEPGISPFEKAARRNARRKKSTPAMDAMQKVMAK